MATSAVSGPVPFGAADRLNEDRRRREVLSALLSEGRYGNSFGTKFASFFLRLEISRYGAPGVWERMFRQVPNFEWCIYFVE